jgi:hypothetical protein
VREGGLSGPPSFFWALALAEAEGSAEEIDAQSSRARWIDDLPRAQHVSDRSQRTDVLAGVAVQDD